MIQTIDTTLPRPDSPLPTRRMLATDQQRVPLWFLPASYPLAFPRSLTIPCLSVPVRRSSRYAAVNPLPLPERATAGLLLLGKVTH